MGDVVIPCYTPECKDADCIFCASPKTNLCPKIRCAQHCLGILKSHLHFAPVTGHFEIPFTYAPVTGHFEIPFTPGPVTRHFEIPFTHAAPVTGQPRARV